MPAEKLAKAHDRVTDALQRWAASWHELNKLLASLRHVCSCIPAGRAFYQHLQSTLYCFGRQRFSAADLDDLLWVQFILAWGHHHAIPTTLLTIEVEPTVYMYMYASDYDLL